MIVPANRALAPLSEQRKEIDELVSVSKRYLADRSRVIERRVVIRGIAKRSHAVEKSGNLLAIVAEPLCIKRGQLTVLCRALAG